MPPTRPAKLREIASRPLVKVCGLTRAEDVEVAVEAGADLCGFILEPASPRAAREVLPVPETVLSVAVFVGEPGRRPPTSSSSTSARTGRCAAATPSSSATASRSRPSSTCPWEEEDETQLERARAVEGRLVLAGGLGPENVRRAIAATRPWAVDASSSLESSPGVKDHDRVRAYVEAAR